MKTTRLACWGGGGAVPVRTACSPQLESTFVPPSASFPLPRDFAASAGGIKDRLIHALKRCRPPVGLGLTASPPIRRGGPLVGILLGLCLVPTSSTAVEDPSVRAVSLAWKPNPEPDVLGYRVHVGEASGTYTKILDVGNQTQARLENLPVGTTYFCAVTAYNTYGLESPYSNEIMFTVESAPASGTVDSDQDGLSDLFEITYADGQDLKPGDDLNGDGLPVLAEYAHGLDPLSPHNRAYTRLEPILVDGEHYLSVRYRVNPAAQPLVSIHVERSPDLSDPVGWRRDGTTIASSNPLFDGSGLVEVVCRSLTSMASQDREFLRFAYEPAEP